MADAYDLRRFAPPPTISFTTLKDGRTYRVDSDPDVDDVAQMLKIELILRGRIPDADTGDALVEGKQLLLRLIQEQMPEVERLKVGSQELLVIFALIVHGSSVAEAVQRAITDQDADEAGEPPEPDPLDDDLDTGGGAPSRAASPLPSTERSSERSSSSDETVDSLSIIGTG